MIATPHRVAALAIALTAAGGCAFQDPGALQTTRGLSAPEDSDNNEAQLERRLWELRPGMRMEAVIQHLSPARPLVGSLPILLYEAGDGASFVLYFFLPEEGVPPEAEQRLRAVVFLTAEAHLVEDGGEADMDDPDEGFGDFVWWFPETGQKE